MAGNRNPFFELQPAMGISDQPQVSSTEIQGLTLPSHMQPSLAGVGFSEQIIKDLVVRLHKGVAEWCSRTSSRDILEGFASTV